MCEQHCWSNNIAQHCFNNIVEQLWSNKVVHGVFVQFLALNIHQVECLYKVKKVLYLLVFLFLFQSGVKYHDNISAFSDPTLRYNFLHPSLRYNFLLPWLSLTGLCKDLFLNIFVIGRTFGIVFREGRIKYSRATNIATPLSHIWAIQPNVQLQLTF